MTGNSHDSDLQTLSARAAQGDAASFRALVDKTHGTAYRLALRLVVGGESDAEDVVQEAYIRVWRALPTLRDHGAVLGFICRVVRNAAADKYRGKKRKPMPSLDAPVGDGLGPLVETIASEAADAEMLLESAQVRDAVFGLVDELKEKYRVVLLLREVDGMSYEELSQAIGVPVGTVESRLHRARAQLAKKVERLLKQQAKETS